MGEAKRRRQSVPAGRGPGVRSKRIPISIRLDEPVYHQLQAMADDKSTSVSQLIRMLLKDTLKVRNTDPFT